MNSKTSRVPLWIVSMILLPLLGIGVVAQVPELGYVVSSHRFSGDPGIGGLYLVSPAGSVTTVSGLGYDLTGSAASSTTIGASSVLINDAAGTTLAVGETGPSGTAIHLHIITLSGNTAVSDVTHFLGSVTSSYGGGIMQSALLPSGDILMATFGIPGSALWQWSASTGAIAQVPVTFPVPYAPGMEGVNALCIDPTGTTAYVGTDNAGTTSSFYSINLGVTPPSVTLIGSYSITVTGLLDNPDGTLTATGWGGSYDMLTVNPMTSAITPTCSLNLGGLNGLVRDSLSGYRTAISFLPSRLHSVDGSCTVNLLASPPVGGWARVSGVAWREGPPLWQVNSPVASFDFGGLPAGPAGPPAIGSFLSTQGTTVSWSSSQPVGTPYEIVVNLVPINPRGHPSAFMLPSGQLVNLDLLDPSTIFLSSGTSIPGLLLYGGGVSIPGFWLPGGSTVSAQMVVADATHSDGFVLSQASQADFINCVLLEDFESATVGNPGTYPAGWVNGGGTYPWRVHSGGTQSNNTGPSGDHTSGSGKYLYCETSSPALSGQTYIVDLPPTSTATLSTPVCQFWYHMYGATMGTLELQQSNGTAWTTVWTANGDHGNSWQQATAPLSAGATASLRFHYTRGTSFTGDAAIDDLRICE